ncbi:MAG: phosphoribosylanthranilate isomerase [Planctomycetota bacterium]|nr:MAG: phosphoribosylanthranilate isomerase [Planctomycetota bacterium]
MIPVKICGITSVEDAVMCAREGARALGFVYYGRSPRAISPGESREIARALPKEVKKVGVFVNSRPEIVMEVAHRVGLDVVQLSGDEPPEDVAKITGVRVIKAFRLARLQDLEQIRRYETVHAVLVDAATRGFYGGTGIQADWELARLVKKFGKPVILAGGLNGGNVTRALRAVQPAGLDVCTGVERGPGVKDPRKVRALFRAIRSHFRELEESGKLKFDPRKSGKIVLEIRDTGRLPSANELLAKARGEAPASGSEPAESDRGDSAPPYGGALLDENPV